MEALFLVSGVEQMARLSFLEYVTAMTGKWGLGEPDTSGEPNRQGFDQWFGYLS
jgi:hypothetical protein